MRLTGAWKVQLQGISFNITHLYRVRLSGREKEREREKIVVVLAIFLSVRLTICLFVCLIFLNLSGFLSVFRLALPLFISCPAPTDSLYLLCYVWPKSLPQKYVIPVNVEVLTEVMVLKLSLGNSQYCSQTVCNWNLPTQIGYDIGQLCAYNRTDQRYYKVSLVQTKENY